MLNASGIEKSILDTMCIYFCVLKLYNAEKGEEQNFLKGAGIMRYCGSKLNSRSASAAQAEAASAYTCGHSAILSSDAMVLASFFVCLCCLLGLPICCVLLPVSVLAVLARPTEYAFCNPACSNC